MTIMTHRPIASVPVKQMSQAGRFYPEQLPAFANEPTRDRFDIVRVGDSVGEGGRKLCELPDRRDYFFIYGIFQPGDYPVFAPGQ